MPGMAADPAIFEYIRLDEDRFKVHWLEWCIPLADEDLKAYARRMCNEIKHPEPVLVGVSFGGVLVQEMAAFLTPRKVIIISSVKSRYEMPRRMRLARKTRFYKLLPTGIVRNIEILNRVSFGDVIKKRLDLYKRYLSVRDSQYLNWAIKHMIHWDRERPIADVIHIHGTRDMVFPIRHISQCIVIDKGTHVMILNRYKWFNENLPSLILS